MDFYGAIIANGRAFDILPVIRILSENGGKNHENIGIFH